LKLHTIKKFRRSIRQMLWPRRIKLFWNVLSTLVSAEVFLWTLAITVLIFDVCFFAHALALLRSRVAKRALEATQQNRVAELEQANVELTTELDQL
jgi:hypothetical protein